MPRPIKCRCVAAEPRVCRFKPQGVPASGLQQVVLTVDELEALRLADLEGLYHDQAAETMNVSRQTFGNIIKSARARVADALINAKALSIEGGQYEMARQRQFMCCSCNHSWQLPHGTGRPANCPQCRSPQLHRSENDRGFARAGRGRGPGCRRNRV